jgi:hypothetical protein
MKNRLNRDSANESNAGRKTKSGSLLTKVCSLSAIVNLCLAFPAVASNLPLPGDSYACGKTLAQWQEIRFRWAAGAISLPTDPYDNAISNNMVLLKNPTQNGGTVYVTLNANQPFVLQLFTYYGNSYWDGSPNDGFCDLSIFKTLQLKLTVDGVQVMDGTNALQYFSQTFLDPPVPITDPGPFSSYVWIQDVGALFPPFSAGMHNISLDVKATVPCFGFLFESHHTWYLTVLASPVTNAVPPALNCGFKGGQFGFNLSGPAGQVVVIEASTNLLNWQPIWINNFDGDLNFTDPRSITQSRRFYRAYVP